jgi:para-nitrobenzyl esterase
VSKLVRAALPLTLSCSKPPAAPASGAPPLQATPPAAGPAASAARPAARPSATLTVRVESGELSPEAFEDPAVLAFKGVPFAAPPVGERRWRPPEPPLPWPGVRAATTFGNSCVQAIRRSLLPWTEEYMFRNGVDEDCLALNVWTPTAAVGAAGSARPVLVYIHGGAFDSGSGEVLLYDGEGLAKKGLVVVTINYRLGVFGFFCHAGLSAESPQHSCGNYGLLDQIAALRWVKRNIAAFGGDPDNVTVAGQSAGASSVHYLTFSPLAKGLFQRAIAQSGPWDRHAQTPERAQAEGRGAELAAKVGSASVAELRALPAGVLFEKYRDSGLQFRPIVDGWVVPDQLAALLARGEGSDVPLLTGITADERSFQKDYGRVTLEHYEQSVRDDYGDAAGSVLAAYPASTDAEASQQSRQLMRDAGLLTLLDWRRARGAQGKAQTFGYLFERAIPWPEHPEYQAFHSGELPYVFDNLGKLNRPWEEADRKLAVVASSYWVNFATRGDPNGPGLPHWPSNSDLVMRLGAAPHAGPGLDAAKARLIEQRASGRSR